MGNCYIITLRESTRGRAATVIPGWSEGTRPGISRFRVRCFASPRNDVDIGSRSRGLIARALHLRSPSQKVRGRREDRVRAAPAVSCAKRTEEYAHEHTGSAEASGLPCAMVYGLLRALPGERLSCHRRSTSCPLKLDASTAASEPHDFAVRDRPPSSVMATTSIASHRAFVTIASAPLAG